MTHLQPCLCFFQGAYSHVVTDFLGAFPLGRDMGTRCGVAYTTDLSPHPSHAIAPVSYTLHGALTVTSLTARALQLLVGSAAVLHRASHDLPLVRMALGYQSASDATAIRYDLQAFSFVYLDYFLL